MVENARTVSELVTDFRRDQSEQADEDISHLKTTIITVSILALIFLINFWCTL
jgi:methyl-accepting chemotaxis protein